MTHCPESIRAQDYLDGELVPAEREAFEAHLATCAICEGELAAYRRVFGVLAHLELWDPGPGLVDRVMAEVGPTPAARWVPVLAWATGGSIAASLAGIAVAAFLPGPRQWIGGLFAEATRSLATSFVFVLKSFSAGAVRAFDGLGAFGPLLARLVAFLHALAASASQPVVALTLWAALVAGVALLWWMRPREERVPQGDHHVGLLGF
jgi:hypothetical protein